MDITDLHVQRAARARLGPPDGPDGDCLVHPRVRRFEPDGEDRYARASPWRWRRSPAPTRASSSSPTRSLSQSYRLTAEGRAGRDSSRAAPPSRSAPRRQHDRRRHRHGADRRHDRAPRSAAHRRRLEDDAGPVLRLPAGRKSRRRSPQSLSPPSSFSKPLRATTPFERAPREHGDHRAPIVRAGVNVRIHVLDARSAPAAMPPRSRRRSRAVRQAPARHSSAAARVAAPVRPMRADAIVPPLTSSAAATPTIA